MIFTILWISTSPSFPSSCDWFNKIAYDPVKNFHFVMLYYYSNYRQLLASNVILLIDEFLAAAVDYFLNWPKQQFVGMQFKYQRLKADSLRDSVIATVHFIFSFAQVIIKNEEKANPSRMMLISDWSDNYWNYSFYWNPRCLPATLLVYLQFVFGTSYHSECMQTESEKHSFHRMLIGQ